MKQPWIELPISTLTTHHPSSRLSHSPIPRPPPLAPPYSQTPLCTHHHHWESSHFTEYYYFIDHFIRPQARPYKRNIYYNNLITLLP